MRVLEERQAGIAGPDPIGDIIIELFTDRVGQPPKDQKELDNMIESGKARYQNKIPPGYKDKQEKEKEPPRTWDGLCFERQYGDLILWEQLIAEAAKRPIKRIILITDDDKEDWWWIVQGRTIGPRPELVTEIRRRAKVEQFYMYSSHRFLNYAQQFLKTNITDESIEQVREVAELKRTADILSGTDRFSLSEALVCNWLATYYPIGNIYRGDGFPDFFVVMPDGSRKAFEVKYVTDRTNSSKWMSREYHHSVETRRDLQGVEITFVFVIVSRNLARDFADRLDGASFPFAYAIGTIEDGTEFFPLIMRAPKT